MAEQVLEDGSDGELFHKCNTHRVANTRFPVFNEKFTFNEPPLDCTRLRLTLWDHDLAGDGNEFWGQVRSNIMA